MSDQVSTFDPLAKRSLGSTGIQAPPLCLGCAPLGDMPEAFGYGVSDEQAAEVLRAAFDGPIPYVDTAAHYGDGESERRIGLVLKEIGGLPDGFVLQTKAGRHVETNDFSGEMVRRRFERSLTLLGLDRVALVYLHDPEHTTFDQAMGPGGPVEVLQRYREQGVIGHLGVAGGPIDVELQYVETGVFDAVITHNRYTLLNRTAEPLLDRAAERGMAVLNAAPYGSGVLAKGSATYPRYAYQEMSPDLLERLRTVEAACQRYGVPLAAAALQFSLRYPRIHSTIIGMTRPERLAQTVALAHYPVPPGLWEELDAMPTQQSDPELTRWES